MNCVKGKSVCFGSHTKHKRTMRYNQNFLTVQTSCTCAGASCRESLQSNKVLCCPLSKQVVCGGFDWLVYLANVFVPFCEHFRSLLYSLVGFKAWLSIITSRLARHACLRHVVADLFWLSQDIFCPRKNVVALQSVTREHFVSTLSARCIITFL